MNLQRSDSIASSTAASGIHDVPHQPNNLNADAEQDDLLQPPSFEGGVFGVLFTITQDKTHHYVRYHWSIVKILLLAWQLFIAILKPEFGWDIDPNSTLWRCVSVLTFRWLGDLGYTVYIAALYTSTAVLFINLGLCLWIAWSIKEQKLEHVWPIKVVRGFSFAFLQLLDMSCMTFLQLGFSCNYSGSARPRLHMALFPEYGCSEFPQMVNAVLSGAVLLLFILMALLVNMAEVEVNPTSKSPRALAHSGSDVAVFVVKALITLVSVFLGWPKVVAVVYTILAAWMVWEYVRWVPHLLLWMNCLKAGVAAAMLSVAGIQVALVFLAGGSGKGGDGDKHALARTLTVAMAISLLPAGLVGALVVWLRTRLSTAAVLRAFQTADPEAIKPQDVYHFNHPRDVEIASRSARVWVDLYTLEKTAVHRAEEIIKAGIALFPDDAYVAMVHADFMLDMLGFSQTGAKQLENVRKHNPGIMCRFMLFVRQQQATQKAASGSLGKGGNMDLLGYVEYQRKQRTVMRHHKDALQAMANFWRILGSSSSIAFTSLSKSLEEIDNSVSKAESAYRVALEMYNNSPRLVRLFARFMETIKQDPWAAAHYYETADRLEESKDYHGQGPSLPDGTPMSRMDDVEKGILVVNAFGDVQVANRKLHEMFGYQKGELDGKNVTVLMPPHEAKRHPAILRRYIDSGDKAAPYFRHPVLALHHERVALTVRIAVSRVSGLGEDSVFIGILEAVPTEPGLGRVWVTREGVLVCCDPGFVTCFGYLPEDVIGTQLYKLLRSRERGQGGDPGADVWLMDQANHDQQELVHRILEEAATATAAGACTAAQPCNIRHKYDFAKECNVTVRRDLTTASILEVHMRLLSNEPQLLMVVERKGAIRHMSGDLAKVLGVRAGGGDAAQGGVPASPAAGAHQNGDHHVMMELMTEAPPCSLDDFLPSPWKALHHKYRRYIKASSSAMSGLWGCRAVTGEGSKLLGPTMRLVGLHGKPVYVHVAVSSREEDGEPVHVVRMARSSLETAICERRLRLRLTEDGVVREVLQPEGVRRGVPDLFDFPADELEGRSMWEFLSILTPAQGRPSQQRAGSWSQRSLQPQPQPAQQQARASPPKLDLLEEAEAVVGTPPANNPTAKASFTGAGGVSGLVGGAGGMSVAGSSIGPGGSQDPPMQYESLDRQMLEAMITGALQNPGMSYRVHVVSPATAAEAAALRNPDRAAALLARKTREAILRLEVALPPAGHSRTGTPGRLQVHAELWSAEALTGVLEINAAGRITNVLEEDIRPAGLLFGLSKEELVGAQVAKLLRFGPGQTAHGLLNDSGVTKKSSLKASKGKTATKVGPIHYLDGFHRDNQPIHLAVQVVGKPRPGNPVTAIIRVANEKSAAARRARKLAAAAAAGATAATAAAVAAAAPKGHHVQLKEVKGKPAAAAGASSGPALQLREAPSKQPSDVPPSLSGGAKPVVPFGSPLPLHLRDGTSSAAEGGATLSPTPSLQQQGPAGTIAELPGVPQPAVALPPAPSAAPSLRPLALPPAVVAEGPPLPGISALAAGVACVIKARASHNASSSGDLRERARSGARAAAKLGAAAGDAAASGINGGGGGRELAGPGSQRSLGADTDKLGESSDGSGASSLKTPPDKGQSVKALEELLIDARGTNSGTSQLQEGASLGGVDKWVATDGEFYQNRLLSASTNRTSAARGAGEEDEEEDEEGEEGEGEGSFGATSRATSSRWGASPRASEYGAVEDEAEADIRTQPNLHGHQHALGRPGAHPGGGGPYGGYRQYGPNGHPHGRMAGGIYNEQPYNHHHHRLQQQQQQGQMHPHHHQWQQQHPGSHWQQHGGQQQQHPWLMPQQDQPGPHHHHHLLGNKMGPDGYWTGAKGAGDGQATEDGEIRTLDDEGLDGESESDDSGPDRRSENSDVIDPADYKRGKRYRKLVKLMNSPQAKKAMTKLKINTTLAILAAASVHVISFALIITGIQKQSAALSQLSDAGGGQRYLQRALVSARALDQALKGKGSGNTYTAADAEMFANDMVTFSNMYRDVTRSVLNSGGITVENMMYSNKLTVWSGYNVSTGAGVYEDVTIWDTLTRVYVSAKDIYQNHLAWQQQGLTVASTLPGAFLLNSGQVLSPGLRQVIDQLLQDAIHWTQTVNILQLTFLLVEGCLVTLCVALGLVYMLKSAFEQRYQLYETFLSIPIGLTRALASQTTHMLSDDESEEEEEEDDAGSQGRVRVKSGRAVGFPSAGASASATLREAGPDDGNASPVKASRSPLPPKRKALFQDSPGPGDHPTRDRTQQERGKARDAALALPSPMVRPKPGTSLSPMTRNLVSSQSGSRRRRRSSMMTASDFALLPPPQPVLPTTAEGGPQKPRLPRVGCWKWLMTRLRRSGSVKPFPPGLLASAGGNKEESGRRTLNRNSKVAKNMLSIVLVYSVLVIVFYSVNYAILTGVENKVAEQAVAEQNAERTYRAVFYAQELAAEENATALPDRISGLRAATQQLRDAYYTLRMGVGAVGVVGAGVERFPFISGRGVVKGSQSMFDLFYADNMCLRLAEHLPCPPSSYRFYEVTRSGADGMMIQLLNELKYLADEAAAAVAANNGSLPGLDSASWDYIYNVGTADLNDANLRISQQHVLDVQRVLQVVVVMHVALFLLLVIVFICFMVLGYLPLMHRMEKEKRRIAEMMSQLPPELDVLRLFTGALLGAKAAAHHHHLQQQQHHHRSSSTGASLMGDDDACTPLVAGFPPAGPAREPGPRAEKADSPSGNNSVLNEEDGKGGGGGIKAYQAWKDILARTSHGGGPNGAVNATGSTTFRVKGKV